MARKLIHVSSKLFYVARKLSFSQLSSELIPVKEIVYVGLQTRMRNLNVLSRQLHRKFFHCSACNLLRKYPGRHAKERDVVDLSYATYQQEVAGAEVGRLHPLVIMHGMMGSRANWHTLAKTFAESGREIVTLDARNHGESPHTERMTYYNQRDDLLRVLDHLDIETAVLLGHSMGGKTAMVTALTYPHRVAGLIVEDVAPTDSPRAGSPPHFLQTMLKISLQLRKAADHMGMSTARRLAKETLRESVEGPMVREFLASNLIQSRFGYKWRLNLDAVINNFHHLSRFPDFVDQQYEGPALFIGGEKSPYISEDNFPEILRLFYDAEVEFIRDAGHWVHFEQPTLFTECVNRFLLKTQL